VTQLEPAVEPEQSVLILLSPTGLRNRSRLVSQLRRGGLSPVAGEPDAYIGTTTVDPLKALLHLQESIGRALHAGGAEACTMLVSIDDAVLPAQHWHAHNNTWQPASAQQ